MAEIRFLHIADLHLDSPFKGISSIPQSRWKDICESTFHAFTRIIEYALENKPDFVLIVGDIYDGENRSLRAQHIFQKGMESLQSEGIPVFLCYGNHDHLSGKWVRFQLPDNVQVFGEEVETKMIEVRGKKVHVTGFSYKERHINEAMHRYYPSVKDASEYHIGMLHGSVEGNEEHDVYAPFRKSDLIGKGYDYWALGHIHKRQVLHNDPPIVYPGNTQSRHRNEKGMKGFYDVSLSKGNSVLHFIPSSSFIYDEIEVSCEGVVHANDLIARIEEKLTSYSASNGNSIVDLILTNILEDTEDLLQSTTKEEWLSVIQECMDEKNPFIIVQQLKLEMSKDTLKESAMLLQLIQQWNTFDWKYTLKELYQHPKGSRYLVPIETDLTKEIIEEVEQLLSKVVAQRSE
ncbi:metallophosphoesterase family protein [Psychrobacillus vulpis]|uniref:DNA repair exonuclease n=1 Tax=Psychrobacillus vulpis TaxID=2325572 RepID=A0A544TNP9_9BACI|nr:DNA repair exonuclease [Psychrobacillus vulpis]TQR19055.1 DNA repair exonuclease [Psychrobacillus vulpis]